MSDSVRPHRRQPTRLPRPGDSPGKNTGAGCYFLLQCMKVKSESEVAQSRLTPSDPMDRSLPGSSVHGTFQARVLEWGAIAFSNVYSIYRHINTWIHTHEHTYIHICLYVSPLDETMCIYTYIFNIYTHLHMHVICAQSCLTLRPHGL